MRLIVLAKSVQPFLKKEYDLNSVFKELVDNPHLSFLGQLISGPDFIILTFLAHKILNGENVNESMVTKIKNNLFIFNKIDFQNENSSVECNQCDGSGEISCDYCDGNGTESCDECDGEGTVECSECDGDGESEDGEKCDECNGSGVLDCNNCGGEGRTDCSNCDYGNERCNDCGGRGEIETSDYIPYTISVYASYDTNLKNKIEYKIQRFENEEFNHSDCLLIYRRDYLAGEGESDSIDHSFQEQTYYDQLIDADLETELINSNRNIKIFSLQTPSEKFEE